MSGIQLLPENGGEPIDVPDTSTVIGRGAFLKVIDKRVSRNHALLEVIDGKLHVKPTHTNPCFLRRGGKGTQQVLTRDVRQPLEEGDTFGLLPDQLFYTITYGSSSLNGVQTNVERQKKAVKKEPAQPSPSRKNDKISKSVKKEVQEEDTRHKPQEKGSFRDVLCADGMTMALPLTKKRKLPAWMIQLSNSSAPAVKKKATPAKTAAPAKRAAPRRTAPKKKYTDDDFFDGDEDDERPPQKSRKPASDEGYKEDSEEEPHRRGKAGRKRQQQDESDDEDQRPKKRKPGKAKPRRKESDEEDEDLGITTSRSRGGRNFGSRRQDELGESSARRPKRAATKNIGSYEEYFLGGTEFDVSDGAQARGDSDSDFHMEADQEGDSGSDWDKRRGSPKKPAKTPAGRTPVRGGRKRKDYRDSDSEEDFEDSGEEYIPRPTKRRGTDGQRRKKPVDSEDEEEEEEEEVQVQRRAKKGPSKNPNKTKKRPCYYGVKCYRRNPDHFKQFSHPGDSEEEEEEEERDNKKGAKADRRRGDNKVGKPEPVKAPVKKKKKKSDDEEDDDLPNTYDYNDSFIDDGGSQSLSQSQRTDNGSDDDVAQLKKEAKAFMKNRKMMKPVADHQ